VVARRVVGPVNAGEGVVAGGEGLVAQLQRPLCSDLGVGGPPFGGALGDLRLQAGVVGAFGMRDRGLTSTGVPSSGDLPRLFGGILVGQRPSRPSKLVIED
jgi:hypothetical protein